MEPSKQQVTTEAVGQRLCLFPKENNTNGKRKKKVPFGLNRGVQQPRKSSNMVPPHTRQRWLQIEKGERRFPTAGELSKEATQEEKSYSQRGGGRLDPADAASGRGEENCKQLLSVRLWRWARGKNI